MKKLSIILILVMLLSLCSCAKQEVIIEDDVSDLELFEFLRPNEFIPDIDTLYHDFTDIVIIATPTTSFKDAKHVILDMYGLPCEIEASHTGISYASRHFKIEKVLSGDKEMTKIDIKENAFTDGKELRIMAGEKLFKPGHRHLLLAKQVHTEDYPYLTKMYFDLSEEITPDNYKYEDYLKAKELFPEAFE